MLKKEKLKEKWNSLLYNHLWLKFIIENGWALLMSMLSAFLFALAFKCFLDPGIISDVHGDQVSLNPIVSGGVSGFSQVLKLIFVLCGAEKRVLDSIFSVFYFVLNIPMIILAFKGIGKRFGFFTLVNVAFVSLFTKVLSGPTISEIAAIINTNGGMLGRALFAGILVGLSSALAFYIESSAGGFDIICYFISLKKGSNTGPFILGVDAIILGSYNILVGITDNWATAFTNILFSIVYLVILTIIIDLINVRNQKVQVEIITDNKDLPELLLSHIPHGATLFKGVGVYSGKERFVVHMIVSTNEVKRVIKVVKELDGNSFVNATRLQQVYGRFHMKTVK